MNTQLVKTLAQIIKTLSKEEQILLESELHPQHDWETIKKRILERNQKIYQREGKSLETSIDEIFAQMREERSQELMQTCFPEIVKGKDND
jgi:predicted phosphohydrolase